MNVVNQAAPTLGVFVSHKFYSPFRSQCVCNTLSCRFIIVSYVLATWLLFSVKTLNTKINRTHIKLQCRT